MDNPESTSTDQVFDAPAADPISPIIQQAQRDGCLSIGTLGQSCDTGGIQLACRTQPVVLLVPEPPARNVKHHLPNPQPPPLGSPMHVEFEAGEHTAIGDSAMLYFAIGSPGVHAYATPLSLPNGLSLTYGQIVALGGDFYGIPNAPISDGATAQDRVTRFTNAFNTLATAQAAVAEAPQIVAVMDQEIAAVNAALAQGQSASSAYAALGDTLSGEWNVITGGGSAISKMAPPGRYLQLAAVNWDHFGQYAVLAYTAGHTAALAQALVAHNSGAKSDLVLAYAMNAFADHFLSDLFSSGHVRTPRKEIYDTVSDPLPYHATVGLLARFMHDEDCLWGLNVTNTNGNAWRGYGDKRYFDTVDLANKTLVDFAIQDSVDEVFLTFSSGVVPPPAQFRALSRIPNLANAQDHTAAQAAGNGSPLFYWDGSVVLRRNDINNLNDYSWTSSWWGWSTLSLLQTSYAPPPPAGYPAAPASSPTVSPGGWQSNQSVPPNWVAGAQVRYAASVVLANYESNIGPWSALTTVAANQAFPSLTGLPIGPAGTVARRVYRQITLPNAVAGPPIYVGQVADNVTTGFIDTTP